MIYISNEYTVGNDRPMEYVKGETRPVKFHCGGTPRGVKESLGCGYQWTMIVHENIVYNYSPDCPRCGTPNPASTIPNSWCIERTQEVSRILKQTPIDKLFPASNEGYEEARVAALVNSNILSVCKRYKDLLDPTALSLLQSVYH